MARITTTDGRTSVDTVLTDRDAANACGRIPLNNRDREFATSLVHSLNTYGVRISHNCRVWLHVLANQQIRRETPVAPVAATPVTMTAALPVPVARTVAPLVPVVVPPAAPSMTTEEINAAAAGMQLTMLMYDIPERAEIANPSGRLRMIGVRLNLSVWIVPTASIPYNLINQLQNAGADVHTADYDASASAGLLRTAVNVMNKELKAAQDRANVSAAEALAELNADDGTNPNTKRRVYERKINAITKRLNQLADELTAGAKVFGVTGAVNFGGMRQAARSMQGNLTARATLYANSATTLREIGTTSAIAMAAAVEADAVPAVIVADMIQDDGRDEDAETLRDAFSDAPETFSLADVGEE